MTVVVAAPEAAVLFSKLGEAAAQPNNNVASRVAKIALAVVIVVCVVVGTVEAFQSKDSGKLLNTLQNYPRRGTTVRRNQEAEHQQRNDKRDDIESELVKISYDPRSFGSYGGVNRLTKEAQTKGVRGATGRVSYATWQMNMRTHCTSPRGGRTSETRLHFWYRCAMAG